MKSNYVIATIIACTIAVAGSSPIMAINARAEEIRQVPSSDSQTEDQTTEQEDQTSEELSTEKLNVSNNAAKTAREKVATKNIEKLEGKKLEQCQKKQAGVETKLSKMTAQGQKQADVFKKILDRVEQFRINKNYDEQKELYDKANAAYEEAVKLGDNASEISDLADCAEGNLKAVVESFREEQKLQISALKTFRSAVNDYIVAVKTSAEKQTESN
ncbi:hypothetical protein EOL73_01990 [Candidatus Saccharibacteria bacterium]|nr:hypothetical protein [Candidatus Saccharibacteria bacterium]NCU40507.1 hypothetical protein [Candidatus Saccharibacteria bacterium]